MANNLGIVDPSIGGSYDTWGGLNDANIARINKAFGDILTFTDTLGTITLTQDQSNNASFKFTGAGATLVTVEAIDDIARTWFVNNARASGSVKFECADGLGASVTLLAGERRLIYSDGTDIIDLTLVSIAIASVTGLQAALDAKAGLASPVFTGNPTAPTPSPGDNDLSIATTGFVKAAIDVILGGVSASFDTLAEIVAGMQPLDGDLTAIAALTTTAYGRALLTSADASAILTLLSLTTVAKLDAADQVITGGARVTVNDLGNLSGATITPDPGDRPKQKITNNGAGSILPGSNNGDYILEVINTAGAGAVTTTGWTLKGDSFDTTTTSKFLCSCHVSADQKIMIITKTA